jgi:selenocysteine-specific elongation factor
MYIVGTSGHIDHGKTSLIRALTGTDCDRLPEEKAREMTIDIGFASMEYPRFGTVSIIDVPGHERFIRNMVAGAWGIDCALLVVALDDGWMPQTEDHFRVLQLLGVQRLIVVLNKADLVSEDMIEMVEEEVREKLENTLYAGSDMVRVSARTGTGIDELRGKIVENLRKLPKVPDSEKPYLFVDRVFAVKGHGTVVTGTLRNGAFHEDETVGILPLGREARVKRIESHHSRRDEGSPSQRTAMNLSGVAVDELRRGYIIYKRPFFTSTVEMAARIHLLEKEHKIRNNAGVEILIGAASLKGRIILLDGAADASFTASIRLDEPWYCYAGEPFIITNPGGFRILGGGVVLLPGLKPGERRILKQNLSLSENTSAQSLILLAVTVRQWIERDSLTLLFSESSKRLHRMVDQLSEEGAVKILGPYVLESAFQSAALRSIRDSVEKSVGLNLKEVAHMASIPVELAALLIPVVMESAPVVEKEGRYFYGEAVTEEALSQGKKSILGDLLALGGEGMEMDKIRDEGVKKELRDLIKLDFVVSLDGNILYHRTIYDDLVKRIMTVFDRQDRIMVPDVRDVSGGLSRKYLLPLLNRMERDGLIKRLGDFRVKA